MASTTGGELLLVLAIASVGCAGEVAESARALEEGCVGCHEVEAVQHAVSRHAVAATSEVFVALRREAERTWRAGAFCDGCHLPVGGTAQGLGCLTCHASSGNLGRGDGALLFEPGAPVKSSFESGRAPHPVEVTGFVASADMCGTCHDVEGPGPFVESAFAHWQASPAAARNESCKDCHFSETPGRPDTAPGHAHQAAGLGSRAAVELLAVALDIEVVRSAASGAGREVVVEIASRAEGHPVPDGASFLREVWLDVRGAGFSSEPRWLSARLMRGTDPVALPTQADRAESFALGPGARRTERFEVPAGGPLEACLRFRRYRADMVAALGLDPGIAGPEVAVRCVEVF